MWIPHISFRTRKSLEVHRSVCAFDADCFWKGEKRLQYRYVCRWIPVLVYCIIDDPALEQLPQIDMFQSEFWKGSFQVPCMKVVSASDHFRPTFDGSVKQNETPVLQLSFVLLWRSINVKWKYRQPPTSQQTKIWKSFTLGQLTVFALEQICHKAVTCIMRVGVQEEKRKSNNKFSSNKIQNYQPWRHRQEHVLRVVLSTLVEFCQFCCVGGRSIYTPHNGILLTQVMWPGTRIGKPQWWVVTVNI